MSRLRNLEWRIRPLSLSLGPRLSTVFNQKSDTIRVLSLENSDFTPSNFCELKNITFTWELNERWSRCMLTKCICMSYVIQIDMSYVILIFWSKFKFCCLEHSSVFRGSLNWSAIIIRFITLIQRQFWMQKAECRQYDPAMTSSVVQVWLNVWRQHFILHTPHLVAFPLPMVRHLKFAVFWPQVPQMNLAPKVSRDNSLMHVKVFWGTEEAHAKQTREEIYLSLECDTADKVLGFSEG